MSPNLYLHPRSHLQMNGELHEYAVRRLSRMYVAVILKHTFNSCVQAAQVAPSSLQSQQLCDWAQGLSWSPQPSSPSPEDCSGAPALWLQRDARRGEALITVPCSLWVTLDTVSTPLQACSRASSPLSAILRWPLPAPGSMGSQSGPFA